MNAPATVQSGAEARIGLAIVIGRCLKAKYANIHELPTMIDLIKKYICSFHETIGTKSIPAVDFPVILENENKQIKIKAPDSDEIKSTGITAFSFSEFFFNKS